MFTMIRTMLSNSKIYYRIHSVYPRKFRDSEILSILPLPVEKAVRDNVRIDTDVLINSKLSSLGKHVYIGKRTVLMNCSSIGSFTSISHDVKIGLMDHMASYVGTSTLFAEKRRGWIAEDAPEYKQKNERPVVIGNDVLISANAMIKTGITINDGAIIGAGAFVNEDVPAYAIVAGTPAKIIRYRFDEALIARLQKSEWWNLPDETIRKAGNFSDPSRFLDAIGK